MARATRWWRWGLPSQQGLRELSCGPGPSPPAAAGGVAGTGRLWEAGTSRDKQSPGLHASRSSGQHALEVQVREDTTEDPGGGRAAAVGSAGEWLPPARPALCLGPEAPGAWSLSLVHLDLRLWFSPQAEMDLEAARNGTARRLDGDFELGSIRYRGPQSHWLFCYSRVLERS